MGKEPNPNRPNRTRIDMLKEYVELEPNRAHKSEEPNKNPVVLVLAGSANS